MLIKEGTSIREKFYRVGKSIDWKVYVSHPCKQREIIEHSSFAMPLSKPTTWFRSRPFHTKPPIYHKKGFTVWELVWIVPPIWSDQVAIGTSSMELVLPPALAIAELSSSSPWVINGRRMPFKYTSFLLENYRSFVWPWMDASAEEIWCFGRSSVYKIRVALCF